AVTTETDTTKSAVVETVTTPVPATAKQSRFKNRTFTSSAENRENLKYQITGSFLGHEYVAWSPLTISLGYFIDPDNILIARYSNYNGSDSVWDNDNSESLRAVTLGVRHFFNNSFNIMPTVYYRRSTKEGDYSIFSGTHGKLTYEDVGIGVRIGNEWQWQNFTLGCDWVGVGRTAIKINDQKTGGSWDDFDSDREYTVTLASFYLGFSF
ncbi:MAG: hypothetical protein K2Q18_00200, partial [Bdellovibrionales bacterium]|nr:hypothetical protein [Bdellovibrionales bacterium]